MKPEMTVAGFCLLVMLGGCQSGWKRLDGAAISADGLAAARANCRIDDRQAALQQAEVLKNNRVSSAPSNAEKMLLKEDHADRRRRVEAEIEACMQQQGYRPAS